jgi:pyridinium-3,5-bisthiocarboxylic acid mononucleotide nickel chelatase
MRAAYLECFSGVSGDMFLGALLEVGVSEELIRKTVASLKIGAQLRISRVDRSGISSTKVDVVVDGARAESSAQCHHSHDHYHADDHHHSHAHNHGDTYQHFQSHAVGHARSQPHGRSLSAIREIIRKAEIPEPASKTAIRAFELLGEAEAGIHNVPVESIHFHEVGAVDSIVDIVCAAVGCHALGVDAFICSPLNVGGGVITCAHGEFPAPAPATLALLKGAPMYSSGVKAELVTPTGAALIRALDCSFSEFPKIRVESIGYGAGSRNPEAKPNVLRISVGELIEEQKPANSLDGGGFETVTVLETTIDDLSPQVLGYVTERLLREGVLDVFVIPAQMKKNRPGFLLTVLCRDEKAQRARDILFSETSTIGIRTRQERRERLERETIPVNTQWGTIRIKQASLNGNITHFSPEYEDCQRIAQERSVALKQVQQEAISKYLAQNPDARRSAEDKKHSAQQFTGCVMDQRALRKLLEEVRESRVSPDEALNRLRYLPFEDLGFVKIDHHRPLRVGMPEVIYCAGKAPEQVAEIFARMAECSANVLATRADATKFAAVKALVPEAQFHALSGCIALCRNQEKRGRGLVAVVCAGTSDLPVAEEAAVTADLMGNEVEQLCDVGVAGLHRLLSQRNFLTRARVLIVCAGMEGALPSVVAGLVAAPVICVPTSVGYGSSFGGLAALLGMLNSCSPNTAVVNIDNGFGAGYLASVINQA